MNSFEKVMAMLCLCHRRPERSFFFRGRQFPVCARCTGILVGYALGIIGAIMVKDFDCRWFWVLLTPMVVDGLLQQLGGIESTNIRRLVTGIFAGIGIIHGIIFVHRFTLWWVTIFVKKFIV